MRCISLLIKRIYEVNPLICAGCGQTIKITGFVTHQAEINRILRGIGWTIKSHEFDPPYEINEISNRDICQLIQGTEDGFAPMEVQTHCDIGPDPPFQESYNPPHWENNRDTPHYDDHIDPSHWEDRRLQASMKIIYRSSHQKCCLAANRYLHASLDPSKAVKCSSSS